MADTYYPSTLEYKEWLETDGHGGFACGGDSGRIARHWHGLLWTARHPPRDRVKVLTAVTERLVKPCPAWLSVLQSYSSHGLQYTFADLDLTEGIVWHWQPSEFLPSGLKHHGHLRKWVRMARELPGVVVLRYQSSVPMELHVTPWRPPDAPPMVAVFRAAEKVTVARTSWWLRKWKRKLDIERECEKDARCRLVAPEKWILSVDKTGVDILISDRDHTDAFARWDAAWSAERQCRKGLTIAGWESRRTIHPELAPLLATRAVLARAADQFVVRTTSGKQTILAGYPWFTDWGRDTMIALPGLLICTGRHDEARNILLHFLEHARDGIIPNLFPEAGDTPQYNTIDATLWMFHAWFRLEQVAPSLATDDASWDALAAILEHHFAGTTNDIRAEADGLLAGGSPGSQLTWMDVKVNGWVPTPRHGKAIEIQGLWYNALLGMSDLAQSRGETERATRWREAAERCAASFRARYLDDARPYPADVVDRDGPGTADWTVRPNAVIPFALDHNILPTEWRPRVLAHAHSELLTRRGMRTLAPGDPDYHGIYRGPREQRDGAYHRGTAWWWLVMPWARGVFDEAERVPGLVRDIPRLLHHIRTHLMTEACIGQMSEIADGNKPFAPRGCFAQAWSVAAAIEVADLRWETLPGFSDRSGASPEWP